MLPNKLISANFENYRLQEPDKVLQSITLRFVDGFFFMLLIKNMYGDPSNFGNISKHHSY